MASPFASMSVSDQLPMPCDPEQWVKVRALSGQQYEAVQDVHRASFMVSSEKWAGFFRANATDPNSDEVQRILTDPLTGHNRHALVREGLDSWSYDAAINRTEPPADQYDAIRDLNDDAIDFIAREVLKRTKPGLFVISAEDAEQAKKNG